MLLSAFCFALMGAFTHGLSGAFDWRIIAFARASINFIFVAALARSTGKPLIFFSAPASLWNRSVAGTLSIFGTFYVFSKLPIPEATSILNTMPLWMALLVAFVSKETLPRSIWIAVVCGIAGVFFIQQPHFDSGNIAVLIGLSGAFFASIAMYNLHRTKNIHPTTVVAHFTLVASIITFFVMLPKLGTLFNNAHYSPAIIIALIGVGASGTVAQLAMTRAYVTGNPTLNSSVGLAQVVFATLIDILLWNRSFDAGTVIGIVLITVPTTLFMAREQIRKIINYEPTV